MKTGDCKMQHGSIAESLYWSFMSNTVMLHSATTCPNTIDIMCVSLFVIQRLDGTGVASVSGSNTELIGI